MVKFHETTYEEHLSEISKCNFHKELQNIINDVTTIEEFSNCILHGPSGIGKYSQALQLISKFSPSQLKYEKKVHLTINKSEYTFKISDIHYEVDFMTLGCNAKIVWNEIFNTIVNIVLSNGINNGIILCHNFNHISVELLDIFYSYIQQVFYLPINLRFLFLTDKISFLPTRIINNALIINIGRPHKIHVTHKFKKHSISCNNLKELYIPLSESHNEYKLIDDIILMIKDKTKLKLGVMRELLYELLTYDIKIYDVLNTIIFELIKDSILKLEDFPKLMNDIYVCSCHYNNNYRPIYHLENMIVKIIIYAKK
tara:strand:+ start:36261 stop:37199 length:939 start_codon:yes stop_codon:yes gene_type:complete